ncbi:COR domain-containing protein [Sagittula stellata]|uniref:non-specific serine/threonine protein kinase n=1 Tax=Sagittula stellata (strain ATCC 700073 / DSM 11524 / E-37) TaxID=388399 RepID=A3K218_SAGS3|nr:COR domain-containing protein [Sagittula stellata]EBA08964.1 hypothetical protein SSE37_04940 [Sagittula stellata E-37]
MKNSENLTVDELIDLERNVLTGSLRLSGLDLKEIPPAVFGLTHLRELNLNNNGISEIPRLVEGLINLRSLSVANNALLHLPDEICHLHHLENLDVGMNKLNYIPDQLGSLTNLSYLRLGSNEFNGLPSSLAALRSLKTLIADNLDLCEFPECVVDIKSLQTLNLSGNLFAEIPDSFVRMTSLKRLVVNNLEIKNVPIEILNRGPGAIINYLHAFGERGNTIELREAKLIIVGEGAVGKTALMQRLVRDVFDEDTETTEGIEIVSWPIKGESEKPLTLNVWDFGGQEIYHSTHQFFLTKRSLYLFIWDARKEDNILNFDYWMNVVSLLSERSPIICVQNKIDERMTTIDEDSIVKKFPNVRSFENVSAATGQGIIDLRGRILGEVGKLDHIGDVLPESWNRVRAELEALGEKFIYKEQYLEICLREGIDKKSAEYLGQYYHDLGVFLHFSDNKILEQIVFLDPEWATGAVYHLVDVREVQENFGKFSFDDLKRHWRGFGDRNHLYLVELMKRFELCFEVGDTGRFIIPELLSHRKPFIAEVDSPLRFEYHYDFMPAGIISRFIVRCNDIIKGDFFWRTGVVLQREGAIASVVSEPLQRKLIITISEGNKSHLLAIIRRELAAIHNSLNNPRVVEMLPCPCFACRKSDAGYYHSFDYLKRAREKRKFRVECKHSLEDVEIDHILEGIKRNNLIDYNQNYGGSIPDTIRIGEILLSISVDKRKLSRLGVDFEDYSKLIGEVSRLNEARLIELERILRPNGRPASSSRAARVMDFASSNGISVIQGAGGSALYELLSGMFF